MPAGSTASDSITPAGSGPPRRTACTAFTRTARCSESCCSPEACSNLVFGGKRRNNLFITNSAGDLYSIRVTFSGAVYPA
jgi:sugar lactone lactonase YvrE